jgi:hypothetical protein
MRTEEIYHEGEEGARRPGIGSVYSFLRVPLCAFVVNILIPVVALIWWFILGLKSDMWTEEIYHEGEEGARRPGIEGAYTFLRVPWCAFVVTILIPVVALIWWFSPSTVLGFSNPVGY